MIKVIKSLRKGDNWKFQLDLDTSVDMDGWSVKFCVAETSKSPPTIEITCAHQHSNSFSGELTMEHTSKMKRGTHFVFVVAYDTNNRRTLTSENSEIIIW